MNLAEFLNTRHIKAVTSDSRKITVESAFVAIKGLTSDGHDFINGITDKCAHVFYDENHPDAKIYSALNKKTNNLTGTPNPRRLLAEIACILEKNPSHDLDCIAITGTNGKTTSTYLLESILRAAGMKPAIIGTVENRFEKTRLESSHTTPGAVELQKLIHSFKDLGARSVCMEVSSHALDQQRTWGTKFKAALFTNLTQDHLDYHHTLDAYFEAKCRLFLEYAAEIRVINTENEYGKKLARICADKNLSFTPYAKHSGLTTTINGIEGSLDILHKDKKITVRIRSKLLGEYNMQNIAGCATLAVQLGIPLEKIEKGITNAAAVPGRLEPVPNQKNLTILVDYAHTPDALEKVLKTLKPLSHKLVCIFGCGGDRDPGKRPVMGKIAGMNSDYVIVTTDNPRTEDPDKIINSIKAGMGNECSYEIIPDREKAIKQGIKLINPGDILLIAGKGHEDYQIIGKQKIHFDDREVAKRHINQ